MMERNLDSGPETLVQTVAQNPNKHQIFNTIRSRAGRVGAVGACIVAAAGGIVAFAKGLESDEALAQSGNTAPYAAFNWNPATPTVGQTTNFDASPSTDAEDGAISNERIKWDFDSDGAYDDAVGQNVAYTFDSAGLKAVGLEVTDSAGATATKTNMVGVNPADSPDPPDPSPPGGGEVGPASPLTRKEQIESCKDTIFGFPPTPLYKKASWRGARASGLWTKTLKLQFKDIDPDNCEDVQTRDRDFDLWVYKKVRKVSGKGYAMRRISPKYKVSLNDGEYLGRAFLSDVVKLRATERLWQHTSYQRVAIRENLYLKDSGKQSCTFYTKGPNIVKKVCRPK